MKFFNLKRIYLFLYFITLFVFFSIFSEYILIYQEKHSLFLFNYSYFHNFLFSLGGITKYISSFFIQFSFYPLFGAFIQATLLWVLAFLLIEIFSKLHKYFNVLGFIPSILILYFFTDLNFGLNIIIAINLNLVAIIGYFYIKKSYLKYVLILILSPVLFIITADNFIIFVIFIIVYELCNKWLSKSQILLFIGVSLLVPYLLCHFYYFLKIEDVPLNSLYEFTDGMGYLYSFIILYLLLYLFSNTIMSKTLSEKKLYKSLSVGVLVLLLTSALYFSYSGKVNGMVTISNFADKGKWEDVLELSSKYKTNNLLVSYYTNLALLNTKKLSTSLFDYNQSMGAKGLAFVWDRSREKSEHGGLVYYTLGFINEAHHWAFEAMVSNGKNVNQIKTLALANLINGKLNNSKKYLNLLNCSLFYSAWAKHYLKLANDYSLLPLYPEILDKIKQRPKKNFFMDLNNIGPNLVRSFQSNLENKQVYEYLLTYMLLKNEVDVFVNYLKKYSNMDRLSELYQQVLLIYSFSKRGEEKSRIVDSYISESVKNKFVSYVNVLKKTHSVRGRVNKKLTEDFGNTYWYYIHFVSPYGNKIRTKRRKSYE